MPFDTGIGIRGQCVDFVRRYYERHFGLTFQDVKNAADMVHIRSLYDEQGKRRSWKTARVVEKGCVIVWAAEGAYAPTGHVAVVTEVGKNGLRVAEVNERGDNKYGTRRLRLGRLGRSADARIVRILEAPTATS